MNIIVRVGLLVMVVGLVVGGCDWRHDDEDDVIIESQNLAPLRGGCVVRGTVRNDGHRTLRVFISWRAVDRHDDQIGTAEVEIRDLPRDERRDYESTRFRDFDGSRPSCDEIDRIKRSVTVSRD